MDLRSFALNFEVSLMMTGADVVAAVRRVEDRYRELATELTLEEWSRRGPGQRYVDTVMRLTAARSITSTPARAAPTMALCAGLHCRWICIF